MSRKPYDPLAAIPSPEAIRERLTETLTLAERLRILLELAERLRLPLVPASDIPTPEHAKGGGRG
ncbi:hypothetical protein [Gemmata sp.]|uniref:hypothetical protein n=1 Tax=Gemmata sp. TaxID=1914242 RepID=UPI003F70B835